MSATEMKFWYLRYLLNNKVSTLLRNSAIIFFAYGKRKRHFFQLFKTGWLIPELAAILARPKQPEPSDLTGCITLTLH